MSPSRPSPRGTSLIEAMAAMVVFTVGILGVMQMNVLASQQNNLARSQTTASKIARDVGDAIERLPIDHPLLTKVTSMLEDDPTFNNMAVADGLVTLQDAVDKGIQDDTIRPLVGAFDSIYRSEGEGNFYQVAWRAWQIANPDRQGLVDQVRILVMVSFPTGGGNTRQIDTWVVKTSPKIVTGDPDTFWEF